MKATKTFRAVKPGEIYPITINAGEDVPSELEAKAVELGCATRAAPENKALTGRATKATK